MRTCPFCSVELSDNLFACRTHWSKVKKANRLVIWAAYNAYLASNQDCLDLAELWRIQQKVIDETKRAMEPKSKQGSLYEGLPS